METLAELLPGIAPGEGFFDLRAALCAASNGEPCDDDIAAIALTKEPVLATALIGV